MSRYFDGASSQCFALGSVIVSTPFTLACWFMADNVTAHHALMSVVASTGISGNHTLSANGSAGGDPVRASSYDGSLGEALTSTGFSASTWHHACGVWAAANDRRAYLDGGGKVTNATSVTPSDLARTSIGAQYGTAVFSPTTGRIALATAWSDALTDEEIAQLAAGAHPSLIRPNKIVPGGAPWLYERSGDARSWFGGPATYTETNGPIAAADGPPVEPLPSPGAGSFLYDPAEFASAGGGLLLRGVG